MDAEKTSLADDLLKGAEAIAGYLGVPRRTIYHAVSKRLIPHFRIGETVCARKSTLLHWMAAQEAANDNASRELRRERSPRTPVPAIGSLLRLHPRGRGTGRGRRRAP